MTDEQQPRATVTFQDGDRVQLWPFIVRAEETYKTCFYVEDVSGTIWYAERESDVMSVGVLPPNASTP